MQDNKEEHVTTIRSEAENSERNLDLLSISQSGGKM